MANTKKKGKFIFTGVPEIDENTKLYEVSGMEKKISDKTKELKDTAQQIKNLFDVGQTTDDDEIPGRHGPLIELTVDPGDDLMDLDTEAELNVLMDINENDQRDEIKVVEVIDKEVIKISAKDESQEETGEEGEEPEKEGEFDSDLNLQDDDSFNNLFSDDEEEVNPLANLINNLPEVSAQELINEIEELKEIIKERQRG